MEHKLAISISRKFVQMKIVQPEFEEVYVYGLELLLSFLIGTFIILLIGFATGKIVQTFIFLLIFIFLRRFTGGHHANTHLKCKLWTIGSYVTVLTLSIVCDISVWAYLPLELFGFFLILRFGPIENIYKPLTEETKRKNKIRSLILFTALSLMGTLIHFYFRQLSNTVFYTLANVIALMLIPILKKGDKTDEEQTCEADR